MNLSRVHPGTVVECNVRGLEFAAPVTAKLGSGELEVDPPRGISYRRVKARQVTAILAPVTRSGQTTLGLFGAEARRAG